MYKDYSVSITRKENQTCEIFGYIWEDQETRGDAHQTFYIDCVTASPQGPRDETTCRSIGYDIGIMSLCITAGISWLVYASSQVVDAPIHWRRLSA